MFEKDANLIRIPTERTNVKQDHEVSAVLPRNLDKVDCEEILVEEPKSAKDSSIIFLDDHPVKEAPKFPITIAEETGGDNVSVDDIVLEQDVEQEGVKIYDLYENKIKMQEPRDGLKDAYQKTTPLQEEAKASDDGLSFLDEEIVEKEMNEADDDLSILDDTIDSNREEIVWNVKSKDDDANSIHNRYHAFSK